MNPDDSALIPGFATSDGTRKYLARFQTSARPLGSTGLMTSALGFGSYRVDEHEPGAGESLALALQSGCNLIDTSTNYRDGGSERLIGQVLSKGVQAGQFHRNEITVVTKVGYIQGQNLEAARLREQAGSAIPELVRLNEDCWHCIHPDFIASQITQSLERLRLETLDAVLLHNPEYFLKASNDHPEYYRRLKQALDALQGEVRRGRIRFYGISSNTFGDPRESPTFTSLEAILDLARPETHPGFQVLQLPLNLFEPGAFFELNQTGKTFLELASARGFAVLINRPLNAFNENQLVRFADVEAPREIDIEEDLKAAFLEVLKIEERFPKDSSLDPTQVCWAHRLRTHLDRLDDSEFWTGVRDYQIRPLLNEIDADLLRSGPAGALISWRESHRAPMENLLQTITVWIQAKTRTRSTQLLTRLDLAVPGLKRLGLARATIEILKSVPGVSCVLVGMRKTRYVRELLEPASVLGMDDGSRAFTPETVVEAFESVLGDPHS